MASLQRIRVVFLWHHHQPPYLSPSTGEYVLPWLLLHAMRDYFDMPSVVAQHEQVRVTFNLVPGLVAQLDDYAQERARDVFLMTAMAHPSQLPASGRRFLLENFFSVHPETMLKPSRRYAELADKARSGRDSESALNRFTDQDYIDLQMWFFLAWCGDSLRRKGEVADLLRKGRGFTQQDKKQLRRAVVTQLRETLDLYSRLAREGRIEISTSPLYHPIMPLLVTTDAAREAIPGVRLPNGSFAFPEDGRRQLEEGLSRVSARMGVPVRGVWPPEGAISGPVLAQMSSLGVDWTMSDEKVLRGTGGNHEWEARRGRSHLQVWRHGETAVFFRDARLSDQIGFVYSRWQPEEAARDFVQRAARVATESGLAAPVLTVAMDGENAWEYYLHGGMRFLDQLYAQLAADRRFELTTPSRVLAEGGERPHLDGVTAGAWIDGSFTTWIGDPVKNRAWEHLAAARTAVQHHLVGDNCPPERAAEILDLVMRAEASDWFWWFGHGHSSSYDPEFDLLFRQHLSAVYGLIGLHPPEGLGVPLEPPAESRGDVQPPVHLISPAVTGRNDSYYKWLSAGRVVAQRSFLHRPRRLIEELLFGFDRERLYLRLGGDVPVGPLMRDHGVSLALHFLEPRHSDLHVRVEGSGEATIDCDGQRPAGLEVAVGSVVEAAIPLAGLGAAAGRQVIFYCMVLRKGREMERFPEVTNIAFVLKGDELDAENWHV